MPSASVRRGNRTPRIVRHIRGLIDITLTGRRLSCAAVTAEPKGETSGKILQWPWWTAGLRDSNNAPGKAVSFGGLDQYDGTFNTIVAQQLLAQ